MNRRNKEDLPDLHVAIRSGQFQDVRCMVLSGEDVNIKDRAEHRTPLMLCAMIDQEAWGVGIARMLLANGAMVGHSDRRGQNALIVACIFGRGELVKMYLKAVDYDPNHRDRYGNTALFYAASSGHEDIIEVLVELLLHFKLPIDKPNKWGMTPYLEACRRGHENIARILEENGSPMDVRDSILHWGASEWWHDHEHRAADATPKKKSYEKPWLAKNSRTLKRTVSESSTRIGNNGFPSISRTSNRTDLEDDVFFPPSIVVSTTKSEIIFMDSPTASKNKPHSRELPSTSTKGRMLFKSWIHDLTKDNNISAIFSPASATPQCLLTQSAPNISSSCSHTGDKRLRNRRSNDFNGNSTESSTFDNSFKQIFQRYEIQSSDSFRQKARTPEAVKIPEIVPEVEHPISKHAGKLTRQQSRMNITASSRMSSSSSSLDLTTAGRKSKAADLRSRVAGDRGHSVGKLDDSTSSVSSEDSAAARMMNAFRRRKGSIPPSGMGEK